MSRADLIALIERVEAAPGPDRSLDWAVHSFVKPGVTPITPRQAVKLARRCGGYPPALPFYTSSLDAAASLVPKRFGYLVGVNDDTPVACVFLGHLFDDDRHWVAASNPALALTAAALRARLAPMEDSR